MTLSLFVKDPGSALTHFIGMIMAAIAALPLLAVAARHDSYHAVAAFAIFAGSMILLYAASTIYHTFNISEKMNKILRKADHMMIFILIAGTYTPVCLIVLGDRSGYSLLALVWGIAIAGIIINALWINCPKWFSSLIYIAMGWVCVLAIRQIILALPRAAFGWLLAGGIIYTVGGVTSPARAIDAECSAYRCPSAATTPRQGIAHALRKPYPRCNSSPPCAAPGRTPLHRALRRRPVAPFPGAAHCRANPPVKFYEAAHCPERSRVDPAPARAPLPPPHEHGQYAAD